MLQALHNLLRKRVRHEQFVVLTARVPDGVSAEAGLAIRDALNDQHPDGWWFLNPGTFHAYFLAVRSGAVRAQRCRIALEALQGRDGSLRELTCAEAEGTLLARFDWRGRPTSMPLGTITESGPPPTTPACQVGGLGTVPRGTIPPLPPAPRRTRLSMDPVQRGPHDAFRAALWRGRCAEDFYPFLRGDDATWCSAGVYAGQWVEREAWNFPGPFYSTTLNLMSLAACDASGDPRLGGGDEPRLILYAPTGSTVEWLWRQPATDAEVRCVLLAMTCDEASSYACDGNRHWNLALVREWWANREPIRSWALHMLRTTKDDAAAYTRGTKGATDHAALRALLAYYDGPARDDLRQYAFFLSEGRLARAGEPLPEV